MGKGVTEALARKAAETSSSHKSCSDRVRGTERRVPVDTRLASAGLDNAQQAVLCRCTIVKRFGRSSGFELKLAGG